MKKIFCILMLNCIATNAFASFELGKGRKQIICSDEENQSINISANRTTISYVNEGETSGPLKITNKTSDGQTYGTYETAEVSVTLSDKGDSMLVYGAYEPTEIRCID